MGEEALDAAGVGVRIVDALQQDVFEAEGFPGAQRVALAGGDEVLQVPLTSDGHDLLALFLVRGVEADGELRADFGLGELVNFGDKAGGGDGDAALAHADALWVNQEAGGFENVVEIHQGFALAHEDHVHLAAMGVQAMGGGDVEDLADDFAGCEVAFEAHESGEAELAINGAADLGRDAEGVAAILGHEDGFDGFAVVKGQ